VVADDLIPTVLTSLLPRGDDRIEPLGVKVVPHHVDPGGGPAEGDALGEGVHGWRRHPTKMSPRRLFCAVPKAFAAVPESS